MFEQHIIEFYRADKMPYECGDCKALTTDPEGHNHWHNEMIKNINETIKEMIDLGKEDTT